MREVVLVDGVRSAFGKLGGGLRQMAASDVGAFVIKGLLERTGILQRGRVDDVMLGCALGDANTNAIARYTTLSAGLPAETSATFVEMQCGSAIAAINHAAEKILAGMSEVAIVGGQESYSTLTAKYSMSNEQYKLIPPMPIRQVATPVAEQDTDMIVNNDLMASTWNISRQAADEYACSSQQRLKKAYASGLIGPEIIPYTAPAGKKGDVCIIDTDEHPRPHVTLASLAALRSVYENGTTTAGNASGRNDGAAFVLMMSAEKAREYEYTPYARWVTAAEMGCQPNLMGIGASWSNLKAMKQAGLRIADIDVFECNEAFAAQNLCVIKDMQAQTGESIDMARWNPNGGAIAIGHPNAASGARIAIFAMKQLEKADGRYAVVSACCGGGQGTTVILENLRC